MGGLYEELSGAKGIRQQGKSQQNISEYNAAVAEQEAKASLLQSEFDQNRQVEEAARIKSRMEANIGAAGGSGSPVAIDLAGAQARESDLEMMLIGYQGQVKSQQFQNQAVLDRLQGKLARQSAKSAARSANVQFGIQLAALAIAGGGGGGGGGGA